MQGQLLRTTDGKLIVPQLESTALQAVAEAGGGDYRTFTGNDSDIDALLDNSVPLRSGELVSQEMQGQHWKQRGPWLAVLLLPLAALAFRRGWLLSLVFLVGVVSPPQQAMAAGWQDLWQRPDQQAAKALSEKDYERASRVAEDPLLRGSAEYRRGNYPQALEDFSRAEGATAEYNRGNALARLGRYEEAISAYDSALQAAPGMEDALANKAAVEALLRRQKQQEKDQAQDKQAQQGEQGQQNKPAQQSKQGQQNSLAQQSQQGEQGQQDKTPQNKGDAGKNQFADAAKALEKQNAGEHSAAEQQAGQQQDKNRDRNSGKTQAEQQPQTDGPPAQAESLSSEEQMAAEQWLRRIPDDPGGLLRRKFLYQYQQRAQREGTGSRQPW